jgi:RHS repeat-associated protein
VWDPNGTYDFAPDFPDVYYTFTGQEEDDELGLYNFKARLYDPVLGRFISPDRIVQAPEDPQTLNRYTYCLNNPLIYTDPSGEIFGIDDLLFFGILFGLNIGYGAYSASRAGMSPWEGAFISAVTSFIGFGVGYGIGTAVTSALMSTATTAAAVSAAQTIGTYVGTFAGGATAGAINAGVYGGNPWQGALYGGLTAVAMLATVQEIIELTGLGNSSSGMVLKDPKTGQIRSAEAVVLKEAEKILGITDQIKQTAEGHFQIKYYVKTFPVEDSGGAMAQQIRDICAAGIGCHRAFDLKANVWKFETNTLHIRSFGDTLVYHWDRFNLTVSFGNFVKHVGVDMIRNTYYAIKDLGIAGGLREGL